MMTINGRLLTGTAIDKRFQTEKKLSPPDNYYSGNVAQTTVSKH